MICMTKRSPDSIVQRLPFSMLHRFPELSKLVLLLGNTLHSGSKIVSAEHWLAPGKQNVAANTFEKATFENHARWHDH